MISNLLAEIISVILFTAVPVLLLRLLKNKQKRTKLLLLEEINSSLELCIDDPLEYEKNIDSMISSLRKKAVNHLKDRSLNEDMFTEVNDRLNEMIQLFRIRYMSVLFVGNRDLTNVLEFIASDNKISQSELYYLFNEIRNNKSLNEAQKDELISNLFRNCIKHNKIIESHSIISSMRLKPFGNLRLIMPYILIIFIIILGINTALYFLRYDVGISKADFTFGVIVFGDVSMYTDYTDRLEEYFKNETGLDVKFEFYNDFGDVEKIWSDIMSNKIQGLILNPGTYATIYNNKPEIFNDLMELFLKHEENKKPYYRSAVITLKSNFIKFLKQKKVNPNTIDVKNLDESAKELIKEYLQKGNFAFTHASSMSGYLLPRIYLCTEFNFNPEDTTLAVFSGNHDKSVEGVLSGEYWAAAIYDANLLDHYKDRVNDIQFLYISHEIPYNSYWIKKDMNNKIKKAIISSFIKLNTNNSEKARQVKGNKYNISGWDQCNNEEYFKLIEPSLELISTKMPKPKVIFKIDKSDEKYVGILQDIVEHTKTKLDSLNSWDLDTSISAKISGVKFVLKIRMFDDIFNRRIPCIMDYSISKNNSFVKEITSLMSEHIQKPNISYEQRIEIASRILADSLVKYISPRPRIYYDQHGLFLNIGKDNGLSNCDLYWDNNAIIPKEQYAVENTRTDFNIKNRQDIEQYKERIVKVRYHLR